MGKLINIANQRFGFWVVKELSDQKNKNNQTQWICECDCGTIRLVTSNSLRTGNSTSCGCNHKPNLINMKFGNLVVLKLDESLKYKGRRYWSCRCICNNIVVATTNQLRNKIITDCGCIKNKSVRSSRVEKRAMNELLHSILESMMD